MIPWYNWHAIDARQILIIVFYSSLRISLTRLLPSELRTKVYSGIRLAQLETISKLFSRFSRSPRALAFDSLESKVLARLSYLNATNRRNTRARRRVSQSVWNILNPDRFTGTRQFRAIITRRRRNDNNHPLLPPPLLPRRKLSLVTSDETTPLSIRQTQRGANALQLPSFLIHPDTSWETKSGRGGGRERGRRKVHGWNKSVVASRVDLC